MSNTLPSLSGILLSRGSEVLDDIIDGVTESGMDEIRNYIEIDSGISIDRQRLRNLSDNERERLEDSILKHRTELEKIACANKKLDVENTKSARDMQKSSLEAYVNLAKHDKTDKSLWFATNFVYITAIIIITAIFGYIFSVTFFSELIPEHNLRFVDQSLGNLYGIINTIIGFFFGNAFKSGR